MSYLTRLSGILNTPHPMNIGIQPELWLDAPDDDTIITATGVTNWADKSGNGRDVVQSISGSQPAHGTTLINGRKTITFDGVDDFLEGSAFLIGLSEYTVFIVMKAPGQLAKSIIAESLSTQPVGNETFLHIGSHFLVPERGLRTFLRNQTNNIVYVLAGSTILFNNTPKLLQYNSTSTSISTFIDGAADIGPSAYTKSGTYTPDKFTVGAGLSNSSPVGLLTGSIGEILIYGKEFSALNKNILEPYFLNKWGV